jgi:hypothetical protein
MTAVSKELQQGNEQLARKTLGRETELRTLQEEVGEKINAMKVAKEELDRKESEREDVLAVGWNNNARLVRRLISVVFRNSRLPQSSDNSPL